MLYDLYMGVQEFNKIIFDLLEISEKIVGFLKIKTKGVLRNFWEGEEVVHPPCTPRKSATTKN